MEICSTPMSKCIKCACADSYNFKAGTTKRFTDLWFPARGIISISLTQIGLFFNSGVNLQNYNFT
jgi:hypothetical protein